MKSTSATPILFITQALVLGLLSLNTTAKSITESIDFSGFGSVGILTSSIDELGFRRDFADPEVTYKGDINLLSLSLLGLQTNVDISNNIEFVGQVLISDQPEQSINTILRIASINITPAADWQIRIGRMSPRFYMLSDSRNIGFATPWTMPIQEFYSPVTNNFIDGFDTTYSTQIGQGHLHTNFSFGNTRVIIEDKNLGLASLNIKSVAGLNFEYEIADSMARFSWFQSNKGADWPELQAVYDSLTEISDLLGWPEGGQVAKDLSIADKKITYASLGYRFDNGSFTVRSEIGSFKSDSAFGHTNNGYISVGKYIGAFTPYIVYGRSRTQSTYMLQTQPPELIADAVEQIILGTNTGYDQDTYALGLRWDFALNMAMKFQWDRKNIKDKGYGLWWSGKDGSYPDGDTKADILSVKMDFIF